MGRSCGTGRRVVGGVVVKAGRQAVTGNNVPRAAAGLVIGGDPVRKVWHVVLYPHM